MEECEGPYHGGNVLYVRGPCFNSALTKEKQLEMSKRLTVLLKTDEDTKLCNVFYRFCCKRLHCMHDKMSAPYKVFVHHIRCDCDCGYKACNDDSE